MMNILMDKCINRIILFKKSLIREYLIEKLFI